VGRDTVNRAAPRRPQRRGPAEAVPLPAVVRPQHPRPARRASAQSWAELLDLPNPATAGGRRIQEALRWPEKKNLARLDTAPARQPSSTC